MKKLLNHKNVLIYLQDYGSADYVYNAVKNYRFDYNNTIILANDNVKNFFKNKKKIKNSLINYSKFYFIKNKKNKYFLNFLKNNSIKNVISTCASNLIDNSNENLFNACIDMNIKINIFVDHWKGSDRLNNYKFFSSYFNIGVIDKDQKKIYAKNMPKSLIKTTGHPVLEKIKKNNYTNNKNILLVSEPLVDRKFMSCFEYKNKKKSLYVNLLSYLNKEFTDYSIYYRPHPKEKINQTISKEFIIDKSDEIISLKKFQIFIGFNSIFLYKASLAGAKIIQLSKNFKLFNDFNFKNNYKFKNIIKKNIFVSSEFKCHKFLKDNII